MFSASEWAATAAGTPSESLLLALAANGDREVREAVLDNSHCPPEAVDAVANRAAGEWDLRDAAVVIRKDPDYLDPDKPENGHINFTTHIAAAMGNSRCTSCQPPCPPPGCPPEGLSREDWQLLWDHPLLSELAPRL